MSQPTVAVIGAGSWGTALAALLADRGEDVVLWSREPDVADGIRSGHRNPLFLTDVDLPSRLRATSDLDEALAGVEVVVNVVPTQHVRHVFAGVRHVLARASVVVTCSKGIEAGTLLTPAQILGDLGVAAHRVVALSGPSFAREVVERFPTAVTAAGVDRGRTVLVRELFATDRFRVYSSDDVVGVELGGALKNVVAIAAGISDGLGFGHNSRAALITRGLAEISRLGVALGGHPLTFAGLSGMGDLVLTCTGGLSRNRAVGVALGEGRTWSQIAAETNEVAEGVHTSRSAHDLGRSVGVEMPIAEQVHDIVFAGADAHDAMHALTGRSQRDEREP
ncbi:MAG: NAD(P)H-dependent glycerol-3-phosphate dehydrogenase [Ilumatobacteraceae bacterium]